MYCRMNPASIQVIDSIYDDVPVTGTYDEGKKVRGMLSLYKEVLDVMKERYPKKYHKYFREYIRKKIDFYERFGSLAIIEILDLLDRYREDENDLRCLSDIYERYASTGFLVSRLDHCDLEHIHERYLAELMKMERSEEDAI